MASEIKDLLLIAVRAAFNAGKEILDVYDSDFAVEHKDDRSPLTLADKNAHNEIIKLLDATEIPVLSEEGNRVAVSERSSWKRYWCVDPLDGTKEFVRRNGEFTVNIALMEDNQPIAGVIFVPVKEELYFGAEGMGAFKFLSYKAKAAASKVNKGADLSELIERSEVLPLKGKRNKFTLVGSRSHMSEETQAYFAEKEKEHGEIEVVSMGSALKICLVAEGAADEYPRFAPTMEWDTAAGHAIVRSVGKDIIDHETGKSLKYNKELLVNNWFIVK